MTAPSPTPTPSPARRWRCSGGSCHHRWESYQHLHLHLHLYSDNQVNLHLVRHPLPSLPTTYVGLEKWLEERWRDKVTTAIMNIFIDIIVKVKY